ncbi:MAG: polysaccharide biosynthesis protein [Sphingomonas sp.]
MTPQRVADLVLSLPRAAKRAVAVSMDLVLCALAVWIAFYLRLDQWIALRGVQWLAVLLSCGLAIPIFVVSGLYRAIFRYSGTAAMFSIVQAALVYGVIYATIITIIQIPTIPRTVGIIQPVVLFLMIGTTRVIASWWLGGSYRHLLRNNKKSQVIIYGAGSAGRQLFHALNNSEMRVVGFIDDDLKLHGRLLLGRPIHSPRAIERLVRQRRVTDILLAIPSASRRRRNQILEIIRPFGIKVHTMPGMTDVAQGRVRISDILELELDDLLGRKTVAPDEELLGRNIRDQVVMVTGAGGSIGSELCRQILACGPATLLLIEISEAALYAIHRELELRASDAGVEVNLVPLLGSVCDPERMGGIIAAWRPATVYHAAAYKHVPLVEHNPAEGVWNNVFGTLTVAAAARDGGVSRVVFVSTDKAVRPTNVMGTTKRLAEQVLQALATTSPGTCFSMVRFGNVLGSSGSVVPLFRQQIRDGGPITITHPEITRYFMSIPEAAQLVIQAGAMAEGGEVFVLDMGEPVKIVDLARRMVELSGLKLRSNESDGDIELEYVGLRPGEKLYEELLIGNSPIATSHSRILKANEQFLAWPVLEKQLNGLRTAVEEGDVDDILAILRRLVPEYAPEGTVVDWVRLQRRADPSRA